MGIAIPRPDARTAPSPPFSEDPLAAESFDFLGPLDMNSLLSNVHTTYGSLLARRFLASMIFTTILPLGGPTAGSVAEDIVVPGMVEDPSLDLVDLSAGAIAVELLDVELGLDIEGVVAAVVPLSVLPVDAVPRGVAGGVSFRPESEDSVSL